MRVKNIIQLHKRIAAGAGKTVIHSSIEGEIHVATVDRATIEIAFLNQQGLIIRENTIALGDVLDNQHAETEVTWCGSVDGQSVAVSAKNQVALFTLDKDLNTFKLAHRAVICGLDEKGFITCLAVASDSIYTGTNQGLWQLGKDLASQNQLSRQPVATVFVSTSYLAIGEQDGRITLLKSSDNQWKEYSSIGADPNRPCCTSLLMASNGEMHALAAADSGGHIRLFHMPSMDVLADVAGHIRSISHLMATNEGLASVSEDGFVHLWKLSSCDGGHLTHVDSIQLNDCLLMTASSVTAHDQNNRQTSCETFLVAAYDRSELYHVICD